MDSTAYREKTLTGATGIELIIALYDGTIRFLYRLFNASKKRTPADGG